MKLTELLNIKYPIIQAPMAGVQGSRLTVAVCNAGGLGSLPCAMLSLDDIGKEIGAIKAGTDKPYNVNFFCHRPPNQSSTEVQQKLSGWKKTLAPYYQEFDIDVKEIASNSGRMPFDHNIADLLERFKPPVVSFHFGLPETDLMERVKSWGSKILSTATTIEEAVWLQQHGVDAIIAQGLEAGGHRGHFLNHDLTLQMGTLALLPQIIKEVSIPVIAAGGITDSKAVAWAINVGAQAVQVGTVYLLCPESSTSNVHRAAIKSPQAYHTALTNIFSGRPARGIVNRIQSELGPINEAAPPFPLATSALTPIRSITEEQQLADFTPLWSGQNTSGCKEISAYDLTLQLVSYL